MPPALSLFLKISSSVTPFCPALCDPMDCSKARLPCPSPTPEAYSNSCPLSQWCHLTISTAVIPFPSCLLSFPESESFSITWLFTSGGQNIGASALVLPMNTQGCFSLGLTGLIFLQSKGLSRVLQHHTCNHHTKQLHSVNRSTWFSVLTVSVHLLRDLNTWRFIT